MANFASPVHHTVDSECLQPREDGWFDARCSCGFSFGPLPGMEEVVDVLMEHAAGAQVREVRPE